MILCIADVLTPDELQQINAVLKTASFVDGKATAGWHARLVKHNTQWAKDAAIAPKINSLIHGALARNALFQMAVRPKSVSQPLFSRYESGMFYGTHVDNAVMTDNQVLMRSDVSLTLFLSDPTTYQGGELVIETTQGEEVFKLEAGAIVTYPSSTLHRVEPITQGIRLVVVAWVQSLVRDPNQREILFDLDTARQTLFQQYGKTPEFDLIAKSHANLLRRWIEL
ncbi:MAG: Fe2+-dependent dioxygenase [Microcoleaceae cyanobacterium]